MEVEARIGWWIAGVVFGFVDERVVLSERCARSSHATSFFWISDTFVVCLEGCVTAT